jgi:hypothetical protein
MSDLNGPKVFPASPAQSGAMSGTRADAPPMPPPLSGTLPGSNVPVATLIEAASAAAAAKNAGVVIETRDQVDAATAKTGSPAPVRRTMNPNPGST